MTADRMYQVRVTGLVPDAVLSGLCDVEVATQEMRTVLSGRFEDQAALYGFLHRLRTLGLDVVEVRQVTGRLRPLASEAVEIGEEGDAGAAASPEPEAQA
jgi:hypothetical protein